MLDPSQILIAASIGLIILLFLALSVFSLLRGIYLKMNGESRSIFAGRPAYFILIVHCFALLIIASIVYAAQIETRALTTSRFEYGTDLIRDRLRIAFLADIDWPMCRVSPEKIVRDLDFLTPDIVIFGGDISIEDEPEELIAAFLKLQCPLKFGVIGNASSDEDAKFYKRVGVQKLDSQSATVELRGSKIFILGIPWFGEDISNHSPFPKDAFRILVTHTPEIIPMASANGFNLYLGAHTHGGQVRFPFSPDLFVPGAIGKLYPFGDFEIGGMKAVISKGIGVARGYNPNMRFLCPPEICLIEFTATKQ